MAEPLPVLIPHPQLHAPRTGYPLANGEVNHVGEPIVMVVATDRYVAEDACERIVVTYEELPVVVGVDAARAAHAAVHDEIPDNVAARHHQETGDVEPALAASPHTLSFTQYIERSACMPMEGKGVHARWDADDSSLRVYTSTQASTSVRAAIAAKLELSLDKVEVIAPDVGGGFGVKIVHPWPEELLVPMAAIALQAEVKWAEDRREHFISSAHERQQRQEITRRLRRRGPDHRPRRPHLARQRRVHALRDHRADRDGDPAGRPVRDPGVPGDRRERLHEHRDRDAVPRRRAAAGLLRDGADDGPHRRRARPRPAPSSASGT